LHGGFRCLKAGLRDKSSRLSEKVTYRYFRKVMNFVMKLLRERPGEKSRI